MTANDVIKLNENVIRCWNEHDVEKFLTYCDPKIIWTDVAFPQPFSGKEGAKKFFNLWVNAFPDMKIKLVNTVASEDSVAVELEFSGTNTGPLKMGDNPEIQATRKKVVAKGSYFAKAWEGKFIRINTYPDMVGMMAQLGLMHEMHA